MSLVPGPLHRERKGSTQTCIEPVSLMYLRVYTNHSQVLQSHDIKPWNAIDLHSTRFCELKIAITKVIYQQLTEHNIESAVLTELQSTTKQPSALNRSQFWWK